MLTKSTKIGRQIFACFIFLNLFIPISAVGFCCTDDYFEVFPNKNYTGKVCIEGTNPDATISMSNKTGLIKSFSVSKLEDDPLWIHRSFMCGTYTFSVAESKNIDQAIIGEQLSIYEAQSYGTLGVVKDITIDASNVSYVNVLWKLSSKLVLFFVSIFIILSSLLYIIRKIHNE